MAHTAYKTGNCMYDHTGKDITSKASPRSTTDGKSLDRDATNKFATPGCNPEEASPSSTPQSRNKSSKMRGGY